MVPEDWTKNGRRAKSGANLLLIQMGADTRMTPDGIMPLWNKFREEDLNNVEEFGKNFLDDEGLFAIVHSGSITHSALIYDALIYQDSKWVLKENFFIWNETPTYDARTGKRVSTIDYLLALSFLVFR